MCNPLRSRESIIVKCTVTRQFEAETDSATSVGIIAKQTYFKIRDMQEPTIVSALTSTNSQLIWSLTLLDSLIVMVFPHGKYKHTLTCLVCVPGPGAASRTAGQPAI